MRDEGCGRRNEGVGNCGIALSFGTHRRPIKTFFLMKWLIFLLAAVAGFLLWRGIAFAAGVPKAGDAAPEFELPDQHGKTRSLAEFRGSWVVLYFFPKADTPG